MEGYFVLLLYGQASSCRLGNQTDETQRSRDRGRIGEKSDLNDASNASGEASESKGLKAQIF